MNNPPTTWDLLLNLPASDFLAMWIVAIIFAVASGILIAWVVAWFCRTLARDIEHRFADREDD